MTCIVGLVHGGKTWIGGDSAGLAGYDLEIRTDKKVFVNNGIAMGFTDSFRMGQLLSYALKVPTMHDGDDLMRFMTVDFINAVRLCLKDGGYAAKQNETETGGHFLVGHKGRLFHINNDYQVAEVARGFTAIGCGALSAIGALYAMERTLSEMSVLAALTIAEKCSGGVRSPFHVVQA
jgi:ATP-dependent protease HslVU (ClpYQ) peptidase subunit